ncbi:MAG: DMT family transporter [Alphaproteobacteria bacterium]|nr:DMT family transporter [Alphaproteobacteria bacterium]
MDKDGSQPCVLHRAKSVGTPVSWYWIPITIAAALSQNIRTALQKSLKGRLSTNGANFTRYVYGLPFAIGYAIALHGAGDAPWPTPGAAFFGWVLLGGVAQIIATSMLIEAMTRRNFATGVAFSKTEVVQAALFEIVALGVALTWGGAAAIVLATIGVMLIALKQSADPWREFLTGWTDAGALLGLASGGFFGVSAVAFRAASLDLGHPSFFMSAGYTLAWAQTLQTAILAAWLIWREPGQMAAVARWWRPALMVGIMGTLGSICWFTAFTIQVAAYVRTLGLIELVFAFLVARFAFQERPSRNEMIGVALLCAGIALVLNLR